MQFVYPLFLIALAALAIPIIIHLFNFRRYKKIAFTNVAFLNEVKKRTQSHSKLKNLLILLTRLLALAFLVFAFAQPFIPSKSNVANAGKKAVSIYVDNSFSMDAVAKEGRLLDLAKIKAQQIGDAFGAADEYQLLTAAFEGKNQRLIDQGIFNESVDEINSDPSTRKLSEIVSRQKNALSKSNAKSKTAVIISDFQNIICDIENIESDSNLNLWFVPLQGNNTANVYIDSVWFDTPIRQTNINERINLKVVNTGDELRENIPLKLTINGVVKAIGSVSVDGKSQTITQLDFIHDKVGFKQAIVKLTDFPITFDDDFYFAYEVSKSINLMHVYGKNTLNEANYINALFKNDSLFNYIEFPAGQIDFNALKNQNFVIVNGVENIASGLANELKRFVDEGGSVLIITPTNAVVSSYNNLLPKLYLPILQQINNTELAVNKLFFDHPIYEDVFEKKPKNLDLPKTQSHFATTLLSRLGTQPLLQLQNGDNLLLASNVNKGKSYLLTSELSKNANNLPQHAIFVATVLRMAQLSKTSNNLYFTLGKNQIAEYSLSTGTNDVLHLINEANTVDVIPQYRNIGGKTQLYLGNELNIADNYFLRNADKNMAALGLNYNRLEGDLATLDSDELQSLVEKYTLQNVTILKSDAATQHASIGELTKGKELWRICLILTLLFLGAEALIIRFWR